MHGDSPGGAGAMSSLGRDRVILPEGGFFLIFHLCPLLPVQGAGGEGTSFSAFVAALQVLVVMLLLLWCKDLKEGIMT